MNRPVAEMSVGIFKKMYIFLSHMII